VHLPWKTQQIYGPVCFTNNDKNKYFPLNQNGVYVTTCLTCYQQYNGETVKTCFPQDGHCIQVVGTKQIPGMAVTKWLYCGTLQCFMT